MRGEVVAGGLLVRREIRRPAEVGPGRGEGGNPGVQLAPPGQGTALSSASRISTWRKSYQPSTVGSTNARSISSSRPLATSAIARSATAATIARSKLRPITAATAATPAAPSDSREARRSTASRRVSGTAKAAADSGPPVEAASSSSTCSGIPLLRWEIESTRSRGAGMDLPSSRVVIAATSSASSRGSCTSSANRCANSRDRHCRIGTRGKSSSLR